MQYRSLSFKEEDIAKKIVDAAVSLWQKKMNPVIYITLAYILGIIIGKMLNLPFFLIYISLVILACYITWLTINNYHNRFLFFILFLLIGTLNLQLRNFPSPKSDISNYPKNRVVTLIGQVAEEPRFKEDKSFFALKVGRVNERLISGKVSVIAPKTKLEYGDKIEIKGYLLGLGGLNNPGLLSFDDYLRNQGINCQLRAGRAPPRVIKSGGNILKKFSIRLKNHLVKVPRTTLPEPYSTLLASIVFGTKASKTSKEIKEIYKKAGVAHLLVASGMHLGILVGVCLFIVRSARLPLGLGIFITSLVNWFYALMTGGGPSILRAAIMAEIMLIGLLFEKEKEVYTSLSLAALIILLYNPKFLFEVGFQLSFAATISLVYIAPVIVDKLKQYWPRVVATTVSVALAPVLVSTPITLYHFNQASLIGILTNVLLLPWVGIVVVLGFVATVLGSLILPLGELINGANLVLLWFMHTMIKTLATLPFAQVFAAPPKLPLIIGYYLGLAGFVEVLRRGKFPKITQFRRILLVLIILSIFVWNVASNDTATHTNLRITILDVGQGDAILIETPNNKRILVDGSFRKVGERVIVPFLRKNGIGKLDLVVLTHPHEDHVGGLPYVVEKTPVRQVLDSGFNYNSHVYRRFLQLIKENKIKYSFAQPGQVINFDQDVKAAILHPTERFLQEHNPNNASIVFRLTFHSFSMMFTGDNEHEGEDSILELFPEAALTSTVLKVGHHGSRTSTSAPFLAAVNPKYAIISCGRKNKFRHPHKPTLERLNKAGIKVYRTDRDGAITIRTDGQKVSLKSAKGT